MTVWNNSGDSDIRTDVKSFCDELRATIENPYKRKIRQFLNRCKARFKRFASKGKRR